MTRFYPSQFEDQLAPVARDFNQLADIINGNVAFNENIKGAHIEAVLRGEDNTVYHGLGYVPVGFLVLLKNGPGDIWGVRVNTWTSEELFLATDVENLQVRLFVM